MILVRNIAKLLRYGKAIASSPVEIGPAVARYTTASDTSRKVNKRLLLIIVGAGFLLRISTILWGVPVLPNMGTYHPDERSTYGHAEQFPGNYGVVISFNHGTTVPYLLATVLLPIKAMVTLDQWRLICHFGIRFLSVLAGTATILLIYLLAMRLYGQSTALLAAAFTALSFTHCLNSAFATPDVIIGFLILACYMALTQAVSLGWLALSGALFGALLGTKLSSLAGLVLLPAMAVVEIARARSQREVALTTRRWIRWAAIYFGAAFVVFAITNPHVLLNFSGFVRFWLEAKAYWFDHSRVPWSEVLAIWWRVSAEAVGAPALIACLAGVVLPSRNRLEKFLILALLVTFYFFHRHHFYPRFAASVAPLICLFAARACTALAAHRWWLMRAGGIVAAGMILAVSGLNTVLGINSRYVDPRTRAARWLKAHRPAGSTVGMAEIYPGIMGWENPRLDNLGLHVVPPLSRPQIIVLSSTSYLIMRGALSSPKLKNWRWDPQHDIDWFAYMPPSPEMFKLFYDLVHETGEYHLVADLEPTDSYPELSFVSPPDFAMGARIYRRTAADTTRR